MSKFTHPMVCCLRLKEWKQLMKAWAHASKGTLFSLLSVPILALRQSDATVVCNHLQLSRDGFQHYNHFSKLIVAFWNRNKNKLWHQKSSLRAKYFTWISQLLVFNIRLNWNYYWTNMELTTVNFASSWTSGNIENWSEKLIVAKSTTPIAKYMFVTKNKSRLTIWTDFTLL